jgi:hypothetical protein
MMPSKHEIQLFHGEIEKIVRTHDLDYIEAIIHYSEKHGMEIESCTKLVGKALRQKLEDSAADKHFIKRKQRAAKLYE